MTKIQKKIKKTNIKNKKKIKYRHYIKDKAIIKFILEHSKKPAIDFSKIKIPSFMEITKNDYHENEKENKNLFNSDDLINKEKVNKKSGFISPKTYTFSISNNRQFWFINNKINIESKIKSSLFNKTIKFAFKELF